VKVFCRTCGIHFPADYNETFSPRCSFWGDRGLGNLPTKLKSKLWLWLTSLPADEILVETGVDIAVSLKGNSTGPNLSFQDSIPDWDKMTEKQKQAYQKIYFKAMGYKIAISHKQIMKQVREITLETKEEALN